MQKSQIFNMNLFESGDPVKAEFFNQNTDILEQALQYRPRMVMGTCTTPVVEDSKATRTLTFDAPPLLVGIMNEIGMMLVLRGCTATATAYATTDSAFVVNAQWIENGVILSGSAAHQVFGSQKNTIYFAFLGEAADGGIQ